MSAILLSTSTCLDKLSRYSEFISIFYGRMRSMDEVVNGVWVGGYEYYMGLM